MMVRGEISVVCIGLQRCTREVSVKSAWPEVSDGGKNLVLVSSHYCGRTKGREKHARKLFLSPCVPVLDFEAIITSLGTAKVGNMYDCQAREIFPVFGFKQRQKCLVMPVS